MLSKVTEGKGLTMASGVERNAIVRAVTSEMAKMAMILIEAKCTGNSSNKTERVLGKAVDLEVLK